MVLLNGSPSNERVTLKSIWLYVPTLWMPDKIIYRQSTTWNNVEGPPTKVLAFAMKEIEIFMAELHDLFPGLWWDKTELKIDADLSIKIALERWWNA